MPSFADQAASELYRQSEREAIVEALATTRVVFLLGARQVGKSTLARQIAKEEHSATVVDFDDPTPRNAALDDPVGFVAGLERPAFIDEVQRGGPDLVLAIKFGSHPGAVVAIEVKSKASLSARDWRSLPRLRDASATGSAAVASSISARTPSLRRPSLRALAG